MRYLRQDVLVSKKFFHLLLITLVAAFLPAGCQRSGPQLVAVSGVVTLDEAPLAGAVVNFQPQAVNGKSPGPGSTGRTTADGRYELETIQREPGAVVGTHVVRIYSYSPETPAAGDSDSGPTQERVPERYNYRSELTFEVPADGTTDANFPLTTKQ